MSRKSQPSGQKDNSNGKNKALAIGSAGLLLLITLVLLLKQLSQSHEGMAYFAASKVTLGGEASPLLAKLRDLPELTRSDIQRILPSSDVLPLSKHIFVARTEVTNRQYRGFLHQLALNPDAFAAFAVPGISPEHDFVPPTLRDVKYGADDQPVVNVDWYSAQTFCRHLNMRLPTAQEYEAFFQFEASLRGTSEFDQPQKVRGKDDSAEVDSPIPRDVGTFRVQSGLLHDIIGNVQEWVQPDGDNYRVMGYSHKDYADGVENFYPWQQQGAAAYLRRNDLGFRCVYEHQSPQTPLLQQVSKTSEGGQCWRTRINLAPQGFNLANAFNRQAISLLSYPMELCQVPAKDYQLGPQTAVASIQLLQNKPLGFADAILGDVPTLVATADFWLDQREVSMAQYQQFLTSANWLPQQYLHPEQPKPRDSFSLQPANWASRLKQMQQNPDLGKRPVTGVDWWSAFAYCNWQNKRLPSRQEWQRAAQSHDQRPYSWGDFRPQITANSNWPDVTPEGVEAMTLSVSEWTSDRLAGQNTVMVKGGNRLWDWQIFGRANVEMPMARDTRSDIIGFRCANDG